MKRYTKYKDSEIQWVGKIPTHWSLLRLKFLHSGTNVGESIGKDFWTEEDNGTLFYTAGIEPIHTTYPSFPKDKLTLKNDLLMARNGTPYVYVPPRNSTYTDHVIRISLHNSYSRKYIFYSLSFAIKSSTVDTVSIPTWSASLWNEQVLPIPPIREQEAIANFLDAKCGEIDRVIGKQRRRIELLEELKQSIITDAVTKGLDLNVTLRPSGIDWIGEIPEHWEVRKIKHIGLLKVRIGYRGYTTADLVQEGEGSYVIGGKHISTNKLDLSNPDYLSWDKYYESPEIMVALGDIIIAQRGSLGKVALVENKIGDATINPSLALLKQITEIPKFIYYFLISRSALTCVELLNTSTAVPMISQNQIENIPIPIPPKLEQLEIAYYLDKETSKIDAQIQRINREIELLEEYKQSIITEVVTGKRCVCDFAESPIVYEPSEPQYNIAAEP